MEVPFASLASDVVERTFPNGLRVLMREVYPSQVTSVFFWVRSGAAAESQEHHGVAHFLEHLLFKGGARRSGHGLADQVRSRGGYLNGFTAHDYTCLWAVFPGRHLERVLELGAQAVFAPEFKSQEIEHERRVILQELRTHRDNPASYGLHRLLAAAYPAHPYGRSILGEEGSVRGMSLDPLSEFHSTYYQPHNTTIVVVGKVPLDSCHAWIDRLLGQAPAGSLPPLERMAQPWGEASQVEIYGDIRSPQLHLGFPVPTWDSPDLPACELLACILGRGRSSRLHQRLRESLQLVSSAGCQLFLGRDPGLLLVRLVLGEDRFEPVARELEGELQRLCEGQLEQAEVEKARNLVESTYVFSQETVEGQARKLGYHEVMGDYRLAEQYARRLRQVQVADVLGVARRYLRQDRCIAVRYRPKTS